MSDDHDALLNSLEQLNASTRELEKATDDLLRGRRSPSRKSKALRRHVCTLMGEAAVLAGVLPIVDQLTESKINTWVVVGAVLVALLLFGVSVMFLEEESDR